MAVVMQMRLPAGSEQPASGHTVNAFRFGQRVLAVARVAQMSCHVVAVRVRQSLQRVDWRRRGSDACLTNGPFSYVPGTHRIVVGWFEALALRAVDIWIDVYPQERHLFAALPRTLRRKAKFGDDLVPEDARGKWLLDRERVVRSKEGDVFVFDVKGVHRGGLVRNGERRIIQVMMS